MILPNTNVEWCLPGQSFKDMVMLYLVVLLNSSIVDVELVIVSLGPYSGGGETVIK